jgi:metal-responsive CopG/Arc/MetJ family transcriptional regulator
MRTIVDLPDEQITALKLIGKAKNQSRAELVRQAVAAYIEAHITDESHLAFGILKGNEIENAVIYQQNLRDEWES